MNSRVGSIQGKHYEHGLSEWGFVTGRNWRSPEHPWHSCQYTWEETFQSMTNYDMMLANRCICGDMAGNYTCCQRNGCSVVDMFIVQRDLLPIIDYFKVLPFYWYSDHAVISASFSVDITNNLETPSEWVMCFSAPQNWDDETKHLFNSRLDKPDITATLDYFCQINFSDCQHAVVNFSEILSDVIKSIFRTTKSQRRQPFHYQIQVAKRVFNKYKTPLGKTRMMPIGGIGTFVKNNDMN